MAGSSPSPVLLAEQTTEVSSCQTLWQRYRVSNDLQTENDLIEQYIPLVKAIVGRLAMTLPPHLEIEELQSAGVIGLLHALRNFKPNQGACFETYARFRIRGAVIDELRRNDWASRTVRDKARRIQNAMLELEQRHSEPATERQVAAELKISLEDYQRWLEEVRPTTFVCLDSASSPDEETSRAMAEIVCDPSQSSPVDDIERREMAELIAQRIKALPEMQRKVLALYYYEDLRLREIAEAFGISESRVSQIHAQAILSIRAFLEKVERSSEAVRLFKK
ncbi:MAG TPA: FliA/WhiG family RNA polymerase sigma factor [Candidatus Limnocylindria bacterium]|nr:FliA/WhiG family RNA polymerase sigma factor [Candidatus Limnocylindria bacterium]